MTKTDPLNGDTLTPYDFVMEEVDLALARLTHASKAGNLTIAEQHRSQARASFRRLVDLYPRLRLAPAERDSLLEQLAILSSRLEESEGRQ
jgi:hypothetical protein